MITRVVVALTVAISTASIATLGSQVYVSNTPRGTELVNTAPPTSDTVQTYTVSGLTRADLLNGAFEVQVRASRGNSNTAFTASLDAVSVTVAYTVPGTAAAPTYDDNGNMTSDGSYGNRTYAYDTLGRLISVTRGGSTTTYALDGAGNRWSQTTGAAITAFDLDLQATNPTILADGVAKYLPGNPGAGYEAAGTWQSAITDLIGSPVLYVATSGATSGLVHYDPYGAPRPGSTAATGIGYAGEYRDTTGLVNLRARSYDPALGRFIGRDTFAGVASAPQTGNRYAYATANPLRFTDPSGHFVQTILDNPLTVVEIAMTFNPVGAALVFGYQFLTGTDPATGERIDPTFSGAGLALVLVPPAIKALAKPAFGALLRGLGGVVGGGLERMGAFGSKLGALADRAVAAVGNRLVGKAIDEAVAGIRVSEDVVATGASAARAISSEERALAGAIRWGPHNGPGPLDEIFVSSGESVASTFRSSNYTQFVSTEEITLYHSFGGRSGPISQFWTRTKPSGPLEAQLDLALNPTWGNSAEAVSTIRVPAGTTIFEGVAGPQALEGGGMLIGGGSQVYIPHVDPAWFVR